LKKEVISLIKTIEKDKSFKPYESGYCDWCELEIYCPAKKHELKVQDLPLNKYLKEEGVTFVNKYASIKSKIKDLKEQEEELQMELDLIEEAAIEYARNEEITTITGSEFNLRISEDTKFQFPRADEEGREALERFIKKAGMWEELSLLNIRRLEKIIEEEELDKKVQDRLLKFAEEIEKTSVRLVKKREEEE
jgi:hypothetical protein